MLEWMHDRDVVHDLAADFATKTLADCEAFIDASQNSTSNLHLAITDAQDTYMGTVSLKHIHDGLAEFAITVRKCAMGKGFSAFAMDSILKIGLQEMGLHSVYWCVRTENVRAVRFYDKNGYLRTDSVPEPLLRKYTPQQLAGFIWYVFS